MNQEIKQGIIIVVVIVILFVIVSFLVTGVGGGKAIRKSGSGGSGVPANSRSYPDGGITGVSQPPEGMVLCAECQGTGADDCLTCDGVGYVAAH